MKIILLMSWLAAVLITFYVLEKVDLSFAIELIIHITLMVSTFKVIKYIENIKK